MTETTYSLINEHTVEIRITTYTGWMMIYRGGRRLASPIMTFRSSAKTRFGAMRDLMQHMRAWHGKVFFLEIVRITRSAQSEVYYASAEIFKDYPVEGQHDKAQ